MNIFVPVVLGLAMLALLACATSSPSPGRDVQLDDGTGIQEGTPTPPLPVDGSSVRQGLSPSPPSTSASQDSTRDSIDVLYSMVTLPFPNPLSPLFGDWPEDRPAIDRLAYALENAVSIAPNEHLRANDRGRHLVIRYGDGTRISVRKVSWCEQWTGGKEFVGGFCNGEHRHLNETWWVEGTGMVTSTDLGLWWEEMPTSMVPIGLIRMPEAVKVGESFSLSGCCWADIVPAASISLSLRSTDRHEVRLVDILVEDDTRPFRREVTVPDGTPSGRYWLSLSSGSYFQLVDLVQVD